jgi:periplasmic divalent cation tolerance protein
METENSSPSPDIRIGWTTVETKEQAEDLAKALIEARLAACVQIDPPMKAFFPWKGVVEEGEELRLWVKYPADHEDALQALLAEKHPYETPQWIAVGAEALGASYAEWVFAECGVKKG